MLYLHEHLSCPNYERSDKPTFEYRKATKGERWKTRLTDNKIIFIVEGEVNFSVGRNAERIAKGKMILLPGGCNYTAQVEDDVCLIICRLKNNQQLCEHFSLEKLYKKEPDEHLDYCHLCMNEPVRFYIYSLKNYLDDDIRCLYFFDIKIKEFFFLLRNYYTKEELQHFFCPLLTNDLFFSEFIQKNYNKVKNVIEFAELAHYSVSGFEKRFKKVFHISAYKWMKEQKAKSILHDILHSEKPLKEIAWEYDFASVAQFSDFCKSSFGFPPGKLRKENMQSA